MFLDLQSLRNLLDNGLATFKGANFDEIAALISRLIARRSSSFRSQYGFKMMRKTNIALCRLKEINIIHALEELAGTIPIFQLPGAKLDLPTRDNFDYVLMRLQSLAALLLRIARCARESSTLFLYYIHRAFFLETSVICVGILAEVWNVARRLCHDTIELYNAMHPFAEHFGQRKNWLSDSVEMPEKMEDFLGEGWAEEWSRPLEGQQTAFVPPAELLNTFDDRSDPTKIMEIPHDSRPSSNKSVKTKADENRKKVPVGRVEVNPVAQPIRAGTLDVGEIVERKPSAPPPAMQIDRIISTDDIQTYVRSEKVRLTQGSGSMSLERWKELQRKINHMLVTSQGRNTVQMFKKFWTMAVLNKKS